MAFEQTCRKCGDVLISGDNWTTGAVKRNDYICKECKAKYQRNYHNKNKEHLLKSNRERYHKNKWKYVETQKYATIKRKYNLSREEYDALMHEASCPICSKEVDLVVDHDHSTGKVRGILCRQCNQGIGLLGDTKVFIEKALKYLRGIDE